MKELREASREIRDRAGRAYIAQRTDWRRRDVRRETDEEIRAAIAQHLGERSA